jgi:protein TonB
VADFVLPANVFSIARESREEDTHVVKDRLMARAIIASVVAHLLLAVGFVCGPLLFASAPSAVPLTIDVSIVDISELETLVPPLAAPKNDEPKARAVIPPPPALENTIDKPALKEKPKVERAKVVDKASALQEIPPPASPPVTSGSTRVGGGTEIVEKARVSYQDMVATILARAKRYPERAVRNQVTGKGVIRLKIDAAGGVVSAEVATSTQSSVLDEELLRMVDRAAPFPAFPPTMSQSQMALLVPVSFRLEN